MYDFVNVLAAMMEVVYIDGIYVLVRDIGRVQRTHGLGDILLRTEQWLTVLTELRVAPLVTDLSWDGITRCGGRPCWLTTHSRGINQMTVTSI